MLLKYCFFSGVLGMGTGQSLPEVLVESSQQKMTPRVLIKETLHRSLRLPRFSKLLGAGFEIRRDQLEAMFNRKGFGVICKFLWVLIFILTGVSLVFNIVYSIKLLANGHRTFNHNLGNYGNLVWIGALVAFVHNNFQITPFGFWLFYSFSLSILGIVLESTISDKVVVNAIISLLLQLAHFLSYWTIVFVPTVELIFKRR